MTSHSQCVFTDNTYLTLNSDLSNGLSYGGPLAENRT
jgi:hypothetical protein